MKTSTRILTGAALLVAVLSPSFGQTAKTKPVGYRTETVKGNGLFNLLSPNLDNAVGASGAFEAAAGTTLTDNEGTFTTAFPDATASLLLKITSGANAGVVQDVVSWTATTITTAENISSLVAAGTSYEIRLQPTIGSLFGAANSAGLLAGAAGAADLVWVPDGAGGYTRIFYSNGGIQGTGWRSVGGGATDRAGSPVSITDSIFIQRKGATDLSIVFTGHVQTTATKSVALGGGKFTPVSRVIPVGVTLGQSGLETELAQGAAGAADLIWNPDGAGGYARLFYSNGGIQGTGWRSVGGGGTDQANTELKSGYLIQRKAATDTPITLRVPTGLDL